MEVMPPFRLKRPRQQYMRDVATCLEALAAGESYEVCPFRWIDAANAVLLATTSYRIPCHIGYLILPFT